MLWQAHLSEAESSARGRRNLPDDLLITLYEVPGENISSAGAWLNGLFQTQGYRRTLFPSLRLPNWPVGGRPNELPN